MDVVVLAGAKNTGALKAADNAEYEAAIPLAGRPLLDYVIRPLLEVETIERIAVVGPNNCLSPDVASGIWRFVPCGQGMLENLRLGLQALAPKGKILIVTGDIPLITARAIEDFLARCKKREADVYYPVVRREPIEARFPNVRRTYASLREGTFTGGNIILIAPEVVENQMKLIEQAVAVRKNPLQMAGLLGIWCLIKLLLGRLSITEIETRVQRKLHFRGAAVITPFAEIGIDVDKPSDLVLVKQALAGETSTETAGV